MTGVKTQMSQNQMKPGEADTPTLRSNSLQKRLLSYAALPTALVLSGGAADAAFIDDYDVSNWLETVGGDGSVDTSGAPTAVELIGSDSGSLALVNVDFRDLFWVKLLGEGGGALQVAEHDRELAAFSFGGGSNTRWCFCKRNLGLLLW